MPRIRLLTLALLGWLLLCGFSCLSFYWLEGDFLAVEEERLQAIEAVLQAPLPQDATRLRYELQGADTSPTRLELSFVTPPEQANAYAASFCGGELRSGFSPFTDLGNLRQFAGMQCEHRGGTLRLLLDQSQADRTTLRLRWDDAE